MTTAHDASTYTVIRTDSETDTTEVLATGQTWQSALEIVAVYCSPHDESVRIVDDDTGTHWQCVPYTNGQWVNERQPALSAQQVRQLLPKIDQ